MKKGRFTITVIGLMVMGQLLAGCQFFDIQKEEKTTDTQMETVQMEETTDMETQEPDAPTGVFTLTSPADGVSALTSLQKNYLKGDYNLIKSYALVGVEQSLPEAITLSWSFETTEKGKVKHYLVEIGEKEDFSDAKEYKTNYKRQQVYNLKLATKYYWRVSAVYAENTYVSEVKSFTTSDAAPRVLKIDGVPNSRDLGGWKTTDGGTVKQGMIYRTEKLTADYGQSAVITQNGIDVMVKDLGIKTEIDLRRDTDGENGGITKSILGDGVAYYAFATDGGDESMNAAIRNYFKLTANEANYPMVIHCSAGTDRTGWLSYLTNALLGVSEEDLYRDYLFSNFGPHSGFYRMPNDLRASRVQNDGVTLRDQVFFYLRDVVGVPEADIKATITLMRPDDTYQIGQMKVPEVERDWSKLY